MPSALCSLEDVRARLKLAADDTTDAVLDAVRAAVEEKILDMTGYDLTGGDMTETWADVQLGVSRLTAKRPLLPLTDNPQRQVRLQARSLASSTLNDILGDVRNAREGRVMPLASELTPVFPPVGGLAPWFRWRQMIWPTVIATYKVDPLGSETNPVPEVLRQAAIEWTAMVYSTPSGGAVSSVTVEGVSETYANVGRGAVSTPPVVAMMLSKHVRRRASLVF